MITYYEMTFDEAGPENMNTSKSPEVHNDNRFLLEQNTNIQYLMPRLALGEILFFFGMLFILIIHYFIGTLQFFELIGTSFGPVFGILIMAYVRKWYIDKIVHVSYVIGPSGIEIHRRDQKGMFLRFDSSVTTDVSTNVFFYRDRVYGPLCGYSFKKGNTAVRFSTEEGFEVEDIRKIWPFFLDMIDTHNMNTNWTFNEYVKRFPRNPK